MLKLTYIENGLYMERVAAPLDVLIAQRVLLAIRTGQMLHVEPGNASFLLSAEACGLAQLELALRLEPNRNISVCPVDDQFVEVSVHGSWIAESATADEGMFVTAFSDRAEFFVYKLWQATQVAAPYLA